MTLAQEDLQAMKALITEAVKPLSTQADNTALLLRLINRQSDELEALKLEVQEIKKKLA